MTPITLTEQDIAGGLPALAQTLTGSAGNSYLLQRTNNINQYSPLKVGQTINVPTNMMVASQPALNPFATNLAANLPRNKIAVEGLPNGMNASAAITDTNVNTLANNTANALFNPYYDKLVNRANETYSAQSATQGGSARDLFNDRNTLDSSFARDTVGQVQNVIGQQQTDAVNQLSDERKLAVAQEVSTQIVQEQAIRDFLGGIGVKETLPPSSMTNIKNLLSGGTTNNNLLSLL
jgi:hypothetical protein